jgi:centromere/kinetochore protein ZW10
LLRFVQVEEKQNEEHFSELYSNLTTVFKVVSQVVPGEEGKWMPEIGRVVSSEMTRLITDHCLKKSVPRTAEELQRYEQVKTATAEFEAGMAELGVVESGFSELSGFTQNIEVYFEEEKRKELLSNARSILRRSIHDTERVVPPEEADPLSGAAGDPPEDGIPTLEDLMCHEDKLKDIGATFPACSVSKCVVEFVELLRDTLHASYAKETEDERMDMFRRVRDLIDLYRAVFPTHHKDDIATIPAAAAVYYNNCMFLVQRLIVESAQLSQRLTPHATFVDVILIVRRMGEDAFLLEMRKQRDSVLRSLKAFGDFGGVSEEDKRDEVYRGVRQGLFQITQLSRVYKGVLPSHVHRDAVGNLLDVLVSYVVKGVLSLEDFRRCHPDRQTNGGGRFPAGDEETARLRSAQPEGVWRFRGRLGRGQEG